MDKREKTLFLLILLIMLVISAIISPCFGTETLSITKVLSIIGSKIGLLGPQGSTDTLFVWQIRMPRVIMASLVGASLAISGAAYQGLFRNPIVDPFILGVSSSSAFGAALAVVIPLGLLSGALSAFLMGLVGVLLTYLIARTRGRTPLVTLILAGMVVNALFSSFVSLIQTVSNSSELKEIVFWLMGGLYYAKWGDVRGIILPVMAGSALIWFLSYRLNILSLGDDEARALGLEPERFKITIVTTATLLTAFSVSKAGIIAWIGLITPHAVRMLIGPDHRYLIPASALLGAITLVICDTLARSLMTAEIPLGIITSLVGAPYLIFLLKSKRKAGFDSYD